MGIIDDLHAIRSDPNKSEEQKRQECYHLKSSSLVDVIYNGKPAPNPISPLIGRDFTIDGLGVRVNFAKVRDDNSLFVDVTLTRSPALPVTHQITIVNPPVIPAQMTGDEKQDLIQAAYEMLSVYA